jgi:hypothetical protein
MEVGMKTMACAIGFAVMSSSALADVSFNLSAQVPAHCGISKASASNGRNATIVVHSSCNAETFRLSFSNAPGPNPIDVAEGNGLEASVQGASVLVRPRFPGNQVTVIHLARDVSPADMGSLSIDWY